MAVAHFVFVHGACHGAWCWYKVRTLLESVGHKATCLDLAGAGVDTSDPNQVASFEQYNRPLTDFMTALPDQEQVILVGHSAGGRSVTDAIFRHPEKIQLAIYVVAGMVRSSGSDMRPDFSPDDIICNYGMGPSQPPTSRIFRKEALRRLLYNRSSHQDSTLASMVMRPFPFFNPSTDQEEMNNEIHDNLDKVKRVFIRTLDDHMLSLAKQDLLIEAWQPWKIFDVDSDHSPFFSAPEQLVAILLQVINVNI